MAALKAARAVASEPAAPIEVPAAVRWQQVGLIALAVAAAYGRTLAVPFYLDDFSSIRENDLISHWQGWAPLWQFNPRRVIAYLTFALDYRLGRFDPAGYHVVNTLIHFAAGLASYALAAGIVRTPRVADTIPPAAARWFPLVASLLFVLHPLHTAAVTYVVQRLASLVALFYFSALAAYVQARLAATDRSRAWWWAACVAATLLAFLSKENAATLPLAVVLIEATFFAPSRRRLVLTAGVAAVAVAVLWLFVALTSAANPLAAGALDRFTREMPGVSRAQYAATQMVVVLRYLRLFAWPAGLHVDYAMPLRGWLRLDVLGAAAVHATLIVLAVLTWRRFPVVAFGILFYYLAHAVESSVIPIRDVVFEHRAYLPDLGACLVAAWLLVVELPRSRAGARAAWVIVPALLLTLGTATWRRNELWRDPIALWRDNVALAPTKARAWGLLGRSLLEANRPEEGARALREAMRLRAESGDVGSGSDSALEAINMIWALRLLGHYDEALALNAASTRDPMLPDVRAKFYINEGNVYFDQGRVADAEAAFRSALALAPHSLPALTNLASAAAQTGRLAEAESLMVEALRVDPDDRNTRFNLCGVRAERSVANGEDLRRAGRTAEALAEYRSALATLEEAARLAPGDSTTAQNTRRVASLVETLEAGRR